MDTSALEQLRGSWLDFLRNSSYKEADSLYWGQMFPLVEQSFIATNKVNEEYDWLILPCGLEAFYYILLIKLVKPKHVYFLGTSEFKSTFLDVIVEKSGLKASQYIMDEISYKGLEIADVYDKIRSHLKLFLNKKVLMDLTRGKRIMSVGAGIVGAFFGFDLVYIDEEWVDNVKRGLPGTETLIMVKNPFDMFGDLELREARDFFNHNNHGAALALYRRIHKKIVDPRNVEIESLVAEAYLYWNSFNFKAAFTKLENATDKMYQYHMPVSPALIENIHALKILSSEDVCAKKNSEEFNIHIIADLYANAMRKADVGLFEDAISRLYRVLELISKYRLDSHGLSDAPENRNQFTEAYKRVTRELYGFEKEIPLEIGIKDGYLLLYILHDYLVEGYSLDDLRRVFGIIRARDISIIAHGLQLAGEKVFVNMKNLAEAFIKTIFIRQGKDFDSVLKQHSFIRL